MAIILHTESFIIFNSVHQIVFRSNVMFYVTYYIAKYFVLFIIDGSSVFFGLTTINSLPLWQVVDVVLFNVDV